MAWSLSSCDTSAILSKRKKEKQINNHANYKHQASHTGIFVDFVLNTSHSPSKDFWASEVKYLFGIKSVRLSCSGESVYAC